MLQVTALLLAAGTSAWTAVPEARVPRVEDPALPPAVRLVAAADGCGSCMLDRGRTRLFCSRRPAAGGRTALVVRRLENGRWSEGRVAAFSGSFHDLDPFPDPAGDRLLFVSFRPPRWNMDLWSVDKADETSAGPQRLTDGINSTAIERSPSLTADGHLYFLRGDTLYRAPREGAVFGEPRALPGEVNGPDRKFDACVAPDESFVVYTSDRPGGHTAMDSTSASRATAPGPRGSTWVRASTPVAARPGRGSPPMGGSSVSATSARESRGSTARTCTRKWRQGGT